MHLHHLQRVLTLCFAVVTKLLKLQLNKTSRLKCSRDRCCIINDEHVGVLTVCKTLYIYSAFVVLDDELCKMHGTYINKLYVLF